jgi:hypothetical protein
MLPDSRYRYFLSTIGILLSHSNMCRSFWDLWHQWQATTISLSHFLLVVIDIQFANCSFEWLHVFRGRFSNYTGASLLVLLYALDDSLFQIRDWFLLLVIESAWTIFLGIYRYRMCSLKSHVQTLRGPRMIKHHKFLILLFLINFNKRVDLHAIILISTEPFPHVFYLVALLLNDPYSRDHRFYIGEPLIHF